MSATFVIISAIRFVCGGRWIGCLSFISNALCTLQKVACCSNWTKSRSAVPGACASPRGITLSFYMKETQKPLKQSWARQLHNIKRQSSKFFRFCKDPKAEPRFWRLNTISFIIPMFYCCMFQLPILVNPASAHKNSSWPHIPWAPCIFACVFCTLITQLICSTL